MDRQYFYISVSGLTEKEMKHELNKFMIDLNQKYENKGFGATVLGMKEHAAKKVEEYLNE